MLKLAVIILVLKIGLDRQGLIFFETFIYRTWNVEFNKSDDTLIDNLCYRVKQEKVNEGGKLNIDELQELLHFPYRFCVCVCFYV